MSVYLILLIRETRIRFRAIYFIQKNLVSLETDPIRRQIIPQGIEWAEGGEGIDLNGIAEKKESAKRSEAANNYTIIIPHKN